ncbi:MAG TPA: glycosyltransferase [Micromonosporaceae bacterium]|nr:glycosyltransferase [Micromonosporaceae bacterium]HCU49945.1 glycosyltransferase [Micromonosporaceae bacterium]
MNVQIVVIAKAPVPGRVKTRLCPPCTPDQAARIADAALTDTLESATAMAASRRVLLLDGRYPPPEGWDVVPQRGDGLASRLGHGFADTALDGAGTLLIGMDTPQITPVLLNTVVSGLSKADAVLGQASDGGWWALALRNPAHGAVLAGVPMSQENTAELTLNALAAQGLKVLPAPRLRDVDTIADLYEVAGQCPHGRFAQAVLELELA